jgi:hypothetical protein
MIEIINRPTRKTPLNTTRLHMHCLPVGEGRNLKSSAARDHDASWGVKCRGGGFFTRMRQTPQFSTSCGELTFRLEPILPHIAWGSTCNPNVASTYDRDISNLRNPTTARATLLLRRAVSWEPGASPTLLQSTETRSFRDSAAHPPPFARMRFAWYAGVSSSRDRPRGGSFRPPARAGPDQPPMMATITDEL